MAKYFSRTIKYLRVKVLVFNKTTKETEELWVQAEKISDNELAPLVPHPYVYIQKLDYNTVVETRQMTMDVFLEHSQRHTISVYTAEGQLMEGDELTDE